LQRYDAALLTQEGSSINSTPPILDSDYSAIVNLESCA